MRRFGGEVPEEAGADEHRGELLEQDAPETKDAREDDSHFASTYRLKPNESYEANGYRYETDRFGRITLCEGTLRLEEGKRNTMHQTVAGGEYRLETDEGGHLIARRFGGSEKIDNLLPMDAHVNRVEYAGLEKEWADELERGGRVEVRVRCVYESDSGRPDAFLIKYKVTDAEGFERFGIRRISNMKRGGGACA